MEKQKSSKNTPNQQTREKIVNALLTLIKEKPLSTITITELTQLAGVSRMAFYRNFSTKEEVFSSHLNYILLAVLFLIFLQNVFQMGRNIRKRTASRICRESTMTAPT